jgi:hypothetical protein
MGDKHKTQKQNGIRFGCVQAAMTISMPCRQELLLKGGSLQRMVGNYSGTIRENLRIW